MGNGSSALVDCVQDCDTQRLKRELASRVADVQDGEISDAELHSELEDAVHTAVSMEITTPQQYQQLQIALELLLQLAPTALQTSECNNAQWTALHRACVTSNLAFVAFLVHRYPQHVGMVRDAFGLLPIDLVPTEMVFIGADKPPTTTEIKALPRTEKERIEVALDLLRTRKREMQQHAVRSHLETHNNQDAAARHDVGETFFIAFEPSRGRLSPDLVGVVHQLDAPLRVRYHLPRADAFVHGYFQLIWRADDDPRSEEPHYDRDVLLLRESVDVDTVAPRSEDLAASNQCEPRRLHDTKDATTLTGSVALDVTHVPDDVVCHVLFVASDRQLMHREIVLSTEGVRLVRADEHDVYEEPPFEYEAESDGDNDVDGFVFHVAGEAFKHPSEALAGREFETIDEFEAFVKTLRKKPTDGDGSVPDTNKDDAVRRPSVLSNQDEDEEPVLVDASKPAQESGNNQDDDAA